MQYLGTSREVGVNLFFIQNEQELRAPLRYRRKIIGVAWWSNIDDVSWYFNSDGLHSLFKLIYATWLKIMSATYRSFRARRASYMQYFKVKEFVSSFRTKTWETFLFPTSTESTYTIHRLRYIGKVVFNIIVLSQPANHIEKFTSIVTSWRSRRE